MFGAPATKEVDTTAMEAKIGRLTLENDFFRACAQQSGIAARKNMINLRLKLSISGQARVLGLSRGTMYYVPAPTPQADLDLMKDIAKLHLAYPLMGQRQLLAQLHRLDYEVRAK